MVSPPLRILFASCHGYIDPSSGASVSARHLLELLSARGHACRAVSTVLLDYQQETPIGPILDAMGLPARRARIAASFEQDLGVIALRAGGVPVELLATASSRIDRSPDLDEGLALLRLADRAFDRFRPQVLLTYGGHPVNLELIDRARRRGIAVVFFLRNLGYAKRRTFAGVSGVLVASEFVRRHYALRLGLDCDAIPSPIRLDRVVADDPSPRFLTFVNPIATKGLPAFARIATELDRHRPDIPILVVEGRGGSDWMRSGLDLTGLKNLTIWPSTPDPREFYRVSRAVLMPSLWDEPFGRVAAEAIANGLPVLASDRGGLPEALAGAGFALPLPARCTPGSGDVPTAEEVAPWLAIIERLWDDPAFEAEQRERSRRAAEAYDPDRLIGRYEAFFRGVIAGQAP